MVLDQQGALQAVIPSDTSDSRSRSTPERPPGLPERNAVYMQQINQDNQLAAVNVRQEIQNIEQRLAFLQQFELQQNIFCHTTFMFMLMPTMPRQQ